MNSPPVERTIRVLDFLTTHPGQAFSHSELSRRVGISKATAHSILTSLTEAGYLLRNNDTRQYSLGPALIPLGSVALRSLPAVTATTTQAKLLAEELDVQCVVVWSTAEEMVILAHAGIPRVSGFAGQAGQRLPLVPPMGTAQMAWATDNEINAWFGRLGQPITDDLQQHYRDALSEVRRRGYAVGYSVDAYQRLSDIYANANGEIHSPEVAAQLREALDMLGQELYLDGESHSGLRPSFLSAPIFDHQGHMILALSLLLDDRFTSTELQRFVRPMMRAAATVTESIDGRRPNTPVTATD
jgi:DNA-binding IclR family transcriptional regulator